MNRLRWLVVGAGDIAGKRIIPALDSEPRCEIVAICDTNVDRARAAASEHAEVYTDMDAAIASPNVDAVYLCTPVYLHTPQAIQALQAGKHVLIEKPVAIDFREATNLVAVADSTDRKCGVAYFRRAGPKFKITENALAKNELGAIVLIRMTYYSWFNPSADDPKYWRVVPERGGGGPLSDMGSHMFDVLIGLLGMPISVYAKTGNLVHDYAVEDSSVIIMTMANGAQVLAGFHWNSKTWTHEFEIVGTEGRMTWHPYDSDSMVKTIGRERIEVATPAPRNVHYPLIEDFVDSVFEDRQPLVTAKEAAKTNLLLDAVYASAHGKTEVNLAAEALDRSYMDD